VVGVSLGLTLGAKFSAVGVVAGLWLGGVGVVLRGGSLAPPGQTGARGVWPAGAAPLRPRAVSVGPVAAPLPPRSLPRVGEGVEIPAHARRARRRCHVPQWRNREARLVPLLPRRAAAEAAARAAPGREYRYGVARQPAAPVVAKRLPRRAPAGVL